MHHASIVKIKDLSPSKATMPGEANKKTALMNRPPPRPTPRQFKISNLKFAIFTRTASLLLALASAASAQDAPQFSLIQRLTNQEVLLKLSAPTGLNYRIEASTNLPQWGGMVTLLSTGLNQHLDSGAPYLTRRFYRAQQVIGPELTGDHLATSSGDVVIHPLSHASFLMTWNGKTIYNDPTNTSASAYASFPKADLILVSHDHTDHFRTAGIDTARGTNPAMIIVPQAVYNGLTPAQKALAIVLTNGASTNILGLTVAAVPAYNFPTNQTVYHAKGVGNGYVLTLGDKRLYMSGDTEDVPEMRALANIDAAFLCMNYPFTMTWPRAVSAVREFRPKILYPYHSRDQSGTMTNAANFKQQLGADLGIEVRLRPWY